MSRKTVFRITLTLFLVFALTLEFSAQPVTFEPMIWTDGDVLQTINKSNQDSHLTSLPPIDWGHYHNYTEIVTILLALNETYPNIVDVFWIGKSWWTRDIYCVRLTNESGQESKPEILFVGYHHARECISAELPLYFVVYAATNFGLNDTITELINNCEIYVVVALNVDGFNLFEVNEWSRKNARPTDEDDDSLIDEDPPDDEDGDGYIEELWQNNVFIRYEGVDDDGDGLLNEDFVGGVDLNRNYGYEWNATVQSGSTDPFAEDYRGPAPFSEPETQAIRALVLQHNFKYAISFHSGAESIVYPWGYTTASTPSHEIFNEIASQMSNLVGCWYRQSGAWYTTSGVWDDWMYGNRSTLAFTCEVYTNSSAWQYEPGPYPNSWWEKGITEFFNPDPEDIETVIQRWLPVFTYITDRAINKAYDIALASVNPVRTMVGQGLSTKINVSVINQGDFTGIFNITLYANTTIIDTLNISVASRNSRSITFIWNTTSWAKGNYTIRAYAPPVTGETDVSDNTLESDWMFVTIPGDVDGDRDVDIYDVVKITGIYWSQIGDSNYKPNSDIDGNGIIDIYDVVKCTSHYWQNW